MSDPPGRLIISGNGNLTKSISRLVDQHLIPHVYDLVSYTKDTIDLLKHLEGIVVHPDSLLVALDVEALFCSIPHKKGIQVVSRFLSQMGRESAPYNPFILKALEFLLENNTYLC